MTWVNFSFRWGEARFKNGSRYNGYWLEGRRHGYGEAKTYIFKKEETKTVLNNHTYQDQRYFNEMSHSFRTPAKSNPNIRKFLLRIENYSGDWRENEKNGFGIIEIEKYNQPPICLFPSQVPPRPTIKETLCYEGCWKDGAYDGWVRSDIFAIHFKWNKLIF